MERELELIRPVRILLLAFRSILPPSPFSLKLRIFLTLISPCVASRLIAPPFPFPLPPPTGIIGLRSNSCVPLAGFPHSVASPALYKVPLPNGSVSVTLRVQVPLGFSPLKSAKLP